MKVIVRILAVLGGLMLLGLVVGVGIWGIASLGKRSVPGRTILEVDLERGMIESVPDDPVAAVMLKDTPVLRDMVEALAKAADDPRVVGLVAKVGAGPIRMAHIQELPD